MTRVPFQLPDVGFREIAGKVYCEREFVVIELRNALMGEFDEDVEIIKIEKDAIEEVRFERGIAKDRLVLRPKGPALLEALPGKHQIEVALQVWRNHRGKLLAFVDEFSGIESE